MPWRLQAMKDVVACDKQRWAGNKLWPADLRMGKPTRKGINISIHRILKQTGRTETSKYPEEKKSTEIPKVVASEMGTART